MFGADFKKGTNIDAEFIKQGLLGTTKSPRLAFLASNSNRDNVFHRSSACGLMLSQLHLGLSETQA